MALELKIPESFEIDPQDLVELRAFLQAVVNRYCVGEIRYGSPLAKRRYMTRLGKEFTAYKANGNAEHLMNIAAYAFLESFAPENKKLHWDAAVESVTRT